MNSLVEIETAVSALSTPEQRSLLDWLQKLVAAVRPTPTVDTNGRNEWMVELADLHRRTCTGVTGMPLQKLMDDLREERF